MTLSEPSNAAEHLLTLHEAITLALQSIPPLAEIESVPLLRAEGRVLAGDLLARLDVPPGDNSAMDGFAVHWGDLSPDAVTRLPIVGQALAGHRYAHPVPRGAAVRITTGALLPEGPDTVIMQEHCRTDPDETWLEIEPRMTGRLRSGENIRRRSEDVQAGTRLLTHGRRLRPQEMALAAGQGIAHLKVVRQPRVAVASTGDELYEPGAELPPGAIYESNRYLLIGLLQRLGCAVTDLGILRDDRDVLLSTLRRAAADHDVLLTSGGVSMGTADLVKDVIADAFLQQILLRPDEYSVVATLNLNGDYISDALAAIVGGIGIAPGANINYLTGHAIFEATHGTAPKYAGQDKVNPGSIILSGVMMLEYMGWQEAADKIVKGLEASIAAKRVTYDFHRQMEGATLLKCSEFGDGIVKNMG